MATKIKMVTTRKIWVDWICEFKKNNLQVNDVKALQQKVEDYLKVELAGSKPNGKKFNPVIKWSKIGSSPLKYSFKAELRRKLAKPTTITKSVGGVKSPPPPPPPPPPPM